MASFKERYEKLVTRFKNASEKAAETAMDVRLSVETIGTAAALGAVRGDFEGNGKKFEFGGDSAKGKKGVDPELVVGVLAKGGSLFVTKNKGGNDLSAVGNGALSAWAFNAARASMYKRAQGTGVKQVGGPQSAGRLEAARARIHEARRRAQAMANR